MRELGAIDRSSAVKTINSIKTRVLRTCSRALLDVFVGFSGLPLAYDLPLTIFSPNAWKNIPTLWAILLASQTFRAFSLAVCTILSRLGANLAVLF